MKYLAEFRDPAIARRILMEIRKITTRPWVIMEVCGGQTHSIIKNGINQMLPGKIELVHGPGCPVCVTPLELIDKAVAIASRPDVIFTSFGDMLRVPGSEKDLFMVKSEGGDVRVVYSPLEAVKIARENPGKMVVFFAVGFETTPPNNAMAVWQAHREGLANFSVLVSHVLVPPAMTALLNSSKNRVQGYLAAGHVCTVMGWQEYEPIAEKYRVPIVVTGFEPVDIPEGVLMVVELLERGEARVENQYSRAVRREGNRRAQELIKQVFEISDRKWRGIGELAVYGTVNDISMSGARPLFLSIGMILEKGFSLENLRKIVESMKAAAEHCGVTIVTGDTKVVNRGKGDKIFINSSGIGLIEHDFDLSSRGLKAGDKILLNGGASPNMDSPSCPGEKGWRSKPPSRAIPHRFMIWWQTSSGLPGSRCTPSAIPPVGVWRPP